MEFTKITPQMLAEIRGLAEEVIPGPEIHDDFCHDELAGVSLVNRSRVIPSVFCAVSCRVPHEGHRLHSKNIAIYDLYITSSISNYEQG